MRLHYLVVLWLGVVGCASRAPVAENPEVPAPRPGAAAAVPTPTDSAPDLAAWLRGLPAPSGTRQGTFAWSLDEAGARLRGRGAVRMDAPERLRLDLFGPRGETYLAAALIGDSPRVPQAVTSRIALPPPALLWAAVGVVRVPASATVSGSRRGEGGTVVFRDADGGRLEFTAGAAGVVGVRRVAPGGALETLDLRRSSTGAVQRAEYRNWTAYRTLVLEFESFTDVAAFPQDTWTPPGV